MAKGIRLRWVDTNPLWLPSRFWAADRIGGRASDGDRFAKRATVVTELYSAHLEAGPPLPAKTSWARFVPTNERGPRQFSGIAMTQDLGLGEVHEVPYEPQILCLPDDQRRLAVLEWLHDNLLALAVSLGWPTDPLELAYQGCVRDSCRFHRVGDTKSSPSRKHKAHIEYEIDGNGDAWNWAVITTNDGKQVATSDRYDGFPDSGLLRRAARSLRWHSNTVVWTPWMYHATPSGCDDLAEARRFTVR